MPHTKPWKQGHEPGEGPAYPALVDEIFSEEQGHEIKGHRDADAPDISAVRSGSFHGKCSFLIVKEAL